MNEALRYERTSINHSPANLCRTTIFFDIKTKREGEGKRKKAKTRNANVLFL